MDPFIQACEHEIWLQCAQYEVTLGLSHTPGAALDGTADTPNHWHLAQVYRNRVDKLVQENSITIVNVSRELFHVSPLF